MCYQNTNEQIAGERVFTHAETHYLAQV